MFEKMTREDLFQLTSVNDGPCISIYIPAMDERTMKFEYEALVRRATHLLKFDKREALREQLLAKLNNFNPSEHLSPADKGLAVFVNKHWGSFYVTGHEMPSKTIVADSFHLKPLLEDLQGNHNFNMLIIVPGEAILYRCDSGKATEVHTFLYHQGQHASSLHWKYQDSTETTQLPNLQSRTRGRGSQDNKFKNSHQKLFLKFIEAKISKEPSYKAIPLLIFSSDPVFQSFKDITSQSNYIHSRIDDTNGIPRAAALMNEAEMQLHKSKQLKKSSSQQNLTDLARKRLLEEDLFKISKAALSGKVKTLYLRDNIEIWGHLRRKSGEITVHEKQIDSKDDDILDDIACEVIRHGGEVMILAGKEMPSPSPAAAILQR